VADRFLSLEAGFLMERLVCAGVAVVTWEPGTPVAPLLARKGRGG
jgi:hypothetical protein